MCLTRNETARGLSTREKGYDQNVTCCAVKDMISLAKCSLSQLESMMETYRPCVDSLPLHCLLRTSGDGACGVCVCVCVCVCVRVRV